MPSLCSRYLLISPVRDEERYIEQTLRSVLNQTIPPVLWLIVDDGSTDRTAAIVERYRRACPFIRSIQHGKAGERHAGSRVIRAFNWGLECVGDVEYDYIVKLDCDLSFSADYFESLLSRLDGNNRLGIASGVYLEKDASGAWHVVKMPSYHAFGACKVVRKRCFEEINGFVSAPGWDTVDEIRAWGAGWETRHFADLETKHHKPEGTGIGRLRTSRMHGEIYHRTGGDPVFFVCKVLHRAATRPLFLGAAALAWGYVNSLVAGRPLLVTPPEAESYRRLLRRRLLGRMAGIFPAGLAQFDA